MSLRRRRVLTLSAATCAGLAWSTGPSRAESAYPGKPITVVVSYPPGGDTDAIARLLCERLSQRLHQPVVIDNRPGAGGAIGNAQVGRAPADGYTLLFTPNPFTTAPLVMNLKAGASYDVLHGFEAVIKTAVQPLVLVAHPGTGFKTLGDLIAAARAGKPVSYASPGAGSPMHVLAEWLNSEARVKVSHVPYRGVGPSVTDVVAGHVDTAWVTLGPVKQYLAQGRLTALAIGDAQRSPLMPEVPTVAEQGYREVVVGAWNGFFAPRGLPSDVIRLLNLHLNEILKQAEVVEKLALFGALPAGGSPDILARTNEVDYQVMSRLIKRLGISAE